MWWRRRAEAEPVHETGVRRRVEVVEDCPQCGEVRAVQAVSVDLPHGDDPDADPRGALDHGVEEGLALVVSHLLRVVQRGEAPYAGAAELRVVEQHAGDDERAGERPPSGLVRARDVTDAEAPVEPEKALAGGASHAAEDSR